MLLAISYTVKKSEHNAHSFKSVKILTYASIADTTPLLAFYSKDIGICPETVCCHNSSIQKCTKIICVMVVKSKVCMRYFNKSNAK